MAKKCYDTHKKFRGQTYDQEYGFTHAYTRTVASTDNTVCTDHTVAVEYLQMKI